MSLELNDGDPIDFPDMQVATISVGGASIFVQEATRFPPNHLGVVWVCAWTMIGS
jgi:hypothetical protein